MSSSESSRNESSCDSENTSGVGDFSDFDLDLNERVIDNYHFISKLGNGAYAEVWLCYNHKTDDFNAIKVQHHDSYEEARDEVRLLRRLKSAPFTSHLIESLIIKNNNKKYYGMVFPLFGNNLDNITRYKLYKKEGLPDNLVRKFLYESCLALRYLHKKLNVIHCDIKPENFLVSTLTTKTKKIIELYRKGDFKNRYEKIMRDNKQNDMKVRKILHKECLKNLNDLGGEYDEEDISKCDFYLSDFGGYCSIDETYNEDYGTRYYRAPENILVSEEMDYKVDVWSLGCSVYELLTNEILFDPEKDRRYNRDGFHLAEIFQLGRMSNNEIKTCDREKRHQYFNKDGSIKDLPNYNLSNINKRLESLPAFWCGLLKKMLKPSYKQRISINEVLKELERK